VSGEFGGKRDAASRASSRERLSRIQRHVITYAFSKSMCAPAEVRRDAMV